MTTKRSLVLLGLVIALAGCGGQPFPDSAGPAPRGSDASADASPQARLLAAIKRTNEAKTARLAIDMSMSGFGDEVGAVKVTGSGEMDLANRRLAMRLEGGVAGQSAEVEMRLVDDTVYIETDGHWSSTTATALGTATPVPSNYLDYLQGIAGAVHVDGREKLRGVATTRYRATVDLNRAIARVDSPAQRDALDRALEQFGLDKMPVMVWIDDAGRLRKMTLTMDLGALAAQFGSETAATPKAVLTLELYDFGLPVSVEAPSDAVPLDAISPIE